ncbi:MAG: ABC-type nitrate/sulfonate/bicarbonate transport system, ATPase component [Oscillospiraceae bacterium]|nr:ABC-type nitrate/sulfonate/bicarbonate transport system, ATPase component [Oscillospiraceae bacterium]
MQPIITLEHLGKQYITKRQTITALDDVNMRFYPGELVSIVGPSGCGKSTIIRMIDDIIKPSSGTITVNGTVYDNQKPISRDMIRRLGFIFQIPNLYPWLTVRQNVTLPLEIMELNDSAHGEYADQLLNMIHLSDYANSYPREISGGMSQRIGVIRGMVHQPDILMMDEPFGALDDETREQLNLELLNIWRETGMTIIFITHNVEEAVLLSQRVYVMASHPGRVTADIKIEFDGPRTLDLINDPKFAAYCNQLETMIGKIELDQIV